MKHIFLCLCFLLLTERLRAQNTDSIFLDSLISSGAIVEVDPEDQLYGSRKAFYLVPGISSDKLRGVNGAHLGIVLDFGHIPYNQNSWFNHNFKAFFQNLLKLHFLEFSWEGHPLIAYNFRAPLVSFRMAFLDRKGHYNYFALHGFLGQQFHFNEGVNYYAISINPSLQIKNVMMGFAYNPKPFFKDMDKTYANYEAYRDDPERARRAEIVRQHSTWQIKISYFIEL